MACLFSWCTGISCLGLGASELFVVPFPLERGYSSFYTLSHPSTDPTSTVEDGAGRSLIDEAKGESEEQRGERDCPYVW